MKKQNNFIEYPKKFCKYCGYPLGMYFTRRFNEYTGEREQELNCTNPKCEEHCGKYIDHQWGSFWKMQHETCQRCGYVIYEQNLTRIYV